MLVLITYDVNTEDRAGRKRLRRVSKLCVDHGIRVQNSVFECIVDASQLRILKYKLIQEMDKEKDSLRFYYLGDKNKSKVEHIGAKATIDLQSPLLF